MPEVLARLHIRQVHLHHRQRGNAAHGIAQRHRSVGVSAGIEHHAEQVRLVGRRLKAVDEHPFVVALQMIDDQRAVVAAAQFVDDVGQRRVAVNLRFATPEKIEVGPVEHQHMRQSRHKHGRSRHVFSHRDVSPPQRRCAKGRGAFRYCGGAMRKRVDRLESTDNSSYICAQKYEIRPTCATPVVQNL